METKTSVQKQDHISSNKILTQFATDLKKVKNIEVQHLLIKEKNDKLQNLVESQMKARFYFKINSPFKNTCTVCKGSGQLYKFNKKVVTVRCKPCNGKGTRKIKCTTCKGSGRFIKKSKGSESVDISCKKCNGKKEIKIQCIKCQATGKIKKTVPDITLKSANICGKCKGLGFFPKSKTNHKSTYVGNPVIPNNLAEKIMHLT